MAAHFEVAFEAQVNRYLPRAPADGDFLFEEWAHVGRRGIAPRHVAPHQHGKERLDRLACANNSRLVFALFGYGLYALNRPDRAERLDRAAAGRIAAGDLGWWRGNRAADLFAALGAVVFGFRWTELLSLIACAAVLASGLRGRARRRAVPLAASAAAAIGIGNFAMHAWLGVASQDRYLFPTVCCSAFALIALLRSPGEGRSGGTS
jgi:hypothetical protein